MTTPKTIKIASIISLVSIGAWLLAVALIDVFQENLITIYYPGNDFSEGAERIFLASTTVHVVSAAVITICNILMIYGKTKLVPLILSGCAALADPVISTLAHNLQFVITAKTQGADTIAKMSSIANFSGYASYILNIAFFCTVAAASVYGYAKKKGLYNENL